LPVRLPKITEPKRSAFVVLSSESSPNEVHNVVAQRCKVVFIWFMVFVLVKKSVDV
jgi:hypothetical protein